MSTKAHDRVQPVHHFPDADNTAATKTITGPARFYGCQVSYNDDPAAAVELSWLHRDPDDTTIIEVKFYIDNDELRKIVPLGGYWGIGQDEDLVVTLPAVASVKGALTCWVSLGKEV